MSTSSKAGEHIRGEWKRGITRRTVTERRERWRELGGRQTLAGHSPSESSPPTNLYFPNHISKKYSMGYTADMYHALVIKLSPKTTTYELMRLLGTSRYKPQQFRWKSSSLGLTWEIGFGYFVNNSGRLRHWLLFQSLQSLRRNTELWDTEKSLSSFLMYPLPLNLLHLWPFSFH